MTIDLLLLKWRQTMLEKLLQDMKLFGALENLPQLNKVKDPQEYARLLLKAEYDFKNNRSIQRKLKTAKFPYVKEWTDLDYSLNPKIDFETIQKLSNCDFLKKHENIALIGTQGTGKTHSLIALGRAICRKNISVRFFKASELVNELKEAKKNYTLSKTMKKIMKFEFIIIDELGYIPFSDEGARLLFDVFASKYEYGSIALSSNLTFDKWTQIFGTIELTAALIDRFTHKSHIYNYKGKSVRLMQSKLNRK